MLCSFSQRCSTVAPIGLRRRTPFRPCRTFSSAIMASPLAAGAPDYSSWTTVELIKRVTELENKLKEQTASYPTQNAAVEKRGPRSRGTSPRPKDGKAFDHTRYHTRHIALKFAYLGQNYNGFEHHVNNQTPLPTIEEEIWKALTKTRLIFPTPKEGKKTDDENIQKRPTVLRDIGEALDFSFDGCDYSKCGRTDRGVSAFGQVIGIRVRSNKPKRLEKPASTEPSPENEEAQQKDNLADSQTPADSAPEATETVAPRPFDSIRDELPYMQMLNRVLPPDIRILAWCPHPPADFSARFSCRERRYKYFFTQPAFSPSPSQTSAYIDVSGQPAREGWLNIAAMREAASYLVGTHDFRNFCKVDPTKQITNFERRIFHAGIEEISDLPMPGFLKRDDLLPAGSKEAAGPKLYAFVVHGSAFLWHQVRHLVAVLFLVGQGLEHPSIVKDLLDIQKTPAKPKYEMANDAPLVLWDCIFPAEGKEDSREDSLGWIYSGDPVGGVEASKRYESEDRRKWSKGGIIEDIWSVWRKRKIDEVLAAALLDVVAAQPEQLQLPSNIESAPVAGKKGKAKVQQRSTRMFDGGDAAKLHGKYVPILEKPKMDTVEVINARWAARKGLNPVQLAERVEGSDVDE